MVVHGVWGVVVNKKKISLAPFAPSVLSCSCLSLSLSLGVYVISLPPFPPLHSSRAHAKDTTPLPELLDSSVPPHSTFIRIARKCSFVCIPCPRERGKDGEGEGRVCKDREREHRREGNKKEGIYRIMHFFFSFFRVRRAARVACSNTSRTPSLVLAEHSRYFWAPIFLRTSSACSRSRKSQLMVQPCGRSPARE